MLGFRLHNELKREQNKKKRNYRVVSFVSLFLQSFSDDVKTIYFFFFIFYFFPTIHCIQALFSFRLMQKCEFNYDGSIKCCYLVINKYEFEVRTHPVSKHV